MTYFHNFYDYIYLYIHSKTSLNNFISNFHFGLTQLFLEHWLMGVIIHLPADLGCQARNHEGKSCLDIAGEKHDLQMQAVMVIWWWLGRRCVSFWGVRFKCNIRDCLPENEPCAAKKHLQDSRFHNGWRFTRPTSAIALLGVRYGMYLHGLFGFWPNGSCWSSSYSS